MEHPGELWQEYSRNGERLNNGGRDSKLKTPTTPGSLFGTVHIWFFRHTPNGLEVLFQKRSQFVDGNPGKWDNSAGGHINYQEPNLDAAIRETKEELGVSLSPEQLEYVFMSYVYNLAFAHCYLVDWSGQEDSFSFDDHEVESVAWVPFAQFDEYIATKVKKVMANDHPYILALRAALESRNGNN